MANCPPRCASGTGIGLCIGLNDLPGDFCCFLAQELPVKLRDTLQVISEQSKPKPPYFSVQ